MGIYTFVPSEHWLVVPHPILINSSNFFSYCRRISGRRPTALRKTSYCKNKYATLFFSVTNCAFLVHHKTRENRPLDQLPFPRSDVQQWLVLSTGPKIGDAPVLTVVLLWRCNWFKIAPSAFWHSRHSAALVPTSPKKQSCPPPFSLQLLSL